MILGLPIGEFVRKEKLMLRILVAEDRQEDAQVLKASPCGMAHPGRRSARVSSPVHWLPVSSRSLIILKGMLLST